MLDLVLPAQLPLPDPVLQGLEAAAAALLAPDIGMAIDFANPQGEPALLPATSMSWRVFKNPVALFIGGVAAVILELAEPRVRTGVWDHTAFRRDPALRLRRTGLAALATVYAARSHSETTIARVRRAHDRVEGRTPAGTAYRANDPELLVWVQATATYGFAEAYSRYVRRLATRQHDQLYAEARTAAAAYGAIDPPTSRAALKALFEAMHAKLEPSPIVFEFLSILRRAPLFPEPLRPMQSMLIRAAVDIVPRKVRTLLGLTPAYGLRAWERPLVSGAAALADRVLLANAPPVLACVRLGLDPHILYRA